MELFNKKFVYFMWDDRLKGKLVFFNDDIDDLLKEVNGNKYDICREICEGKSINDNLPFQVIGDSYRYVYYDPNLECKIGYYEGKQIQARLKGFDDCDWVDVKMPSWEDDHVFRIKPENLNFEKEPPFNSAISQIDNLVSNLSKVKNELIQHKMISEDDWIECFRLFNESKTNGELAEVTK